MDFLNFFRARFLGMLGVALVFLACGTAGCGMGGAKTTSSETSRPVNAAVTGKNQDNTQPDAIGARLQAAKAENQRDVFNSKQALAAVIEARFNKAADAGDLPMAETLQAAKEQAARDGSIPESVKDDGILKARGQTKLAVENANSELAEAYKRAVRDYTRARQISEARAVQDEFAAWKLNQPATGVVTSRASGESAINTPNLGSTQGPARLSSGLPAYLTCRGSYNVLKDGIMLPDNTYVVSKETDFLTRDFVLDLWMTVDTRKPETFIGLGSAQDENGIPAKSLSMLVNHFSNGGLLVVGDNFHAEDIGREAEPGDYMIRVEKKGTAVTFSIGVEKGGQFAPDFSRAFPDIRQTCPEFNDHNVRLFFRSGYFKQVLLTPHTSK